MATNRPVRTAIPGYGVLLRLPNELDVIARRLLKLHVAERPGRGLAGRPHCLYCQESWVCRPAGWAKGWQAARTVGWVRGLWQRRTWRGSR